MTKIQKAIQLINEKGSDFVSTLPARNVLKAIVHNHLERESTDVPDERKNLSKQDMMSFYVAINNFEKSVRKNRGITSFGDDNFKRETKTVKKEMQKKVEETVFLEQLKQTIQGAG